jgi:hypothetical protein
MPTIRFPHLQISYMQKSVKAELSRSEADNASSIFMGGGGAAVGGVLIKGCCIITSLQPHRSRVNSLRERRGNVTIHIGGPWDATTAQLPVRPACRTGTLDQRSEDIGRSADASITAGVLMRRADECIASHVYPAKHSAQTDFYFKPCASPYNVNGLHTMKEF